MIMLRLILSCFLIAATVLGCGRGYVPLQPLKLETGRQNKLVPAPELVSPAYLENIKTVLDFYGEDYRTNASGELLIQCRLSHDKELLWNYSKKALDASFVERARRELELNAIGKP